VELARFLQWMEDMDSEPDWAVLDLRHPVEAAPYVDKFGAERWTALEYGQVRARHGELSPDKTYILMCNAGPRSYEVQVFLDHLGTVDTLVLCGGMNVISRLGVDWSIG
jgi:rhodanese-related sulfurtransferase